MAPDELLYHIQTNQIEYTHRIFKVFQHKLEKNNFMYTKLKSDSKNAF